MILTEIAAIVPVINTGILAWIIWSMHRHGRR